MKLNWGTGIFIFYTVFVIFIVGLVFMSSQEKVDLVTEDYYQKELVFEEVMRKKNNANALEEGLKYELQGKQIILSFPSQQDDITGQISVYRPSNKSLDQNFEIALNEDNSMIVKMEDSPAGLYKLLVDWSSNSIEYYVEQDVYLKP